MRTLMNGKLSSLVLGCAAVAATLFGVACSSEPHPFKEAQTFAGNSEYPEGITVDAKTLNDGYEAYTHYCYACHGEKGDGKGPASYGLRPPPRDFTKGIFKFARVTSSDELPHDTDFYRIVRGGLHGSAMLPWDIPQVELEKIIHYIKTFAPDKFQKKKKKRGSTEMELVKTLEPFEVPEDPWAGKEAEGIALGKDLYHLKAECLNCHPSYGGKQEVYELSVAANKRDPAFSVLKGFREDPNGSVAKDSEAYGVRLLPPDFLFHPVRSATDPHNVVGDLYRIIAYGVNPIMPAWKGALKEPEIWAIAHYVKSLMDMKDTPAAAKFKAGLATQPAFEVPKGEEPKPTEPTPEPAADEKKDDAKKDAPKDDAKKAAPKDDAKKTEPAKKPADKKAP
jgi:mono/diheme cytochrome c family protein